MCAPNHIHFLPQAITQIVSNNLESIKVSTPNSSQVLKVFFTRRDDTLGVGIVTINAQVREDNFLGQTI